MKAIGYSENLPITDPDALRAFERPVPVPGPRDLLVEIEAVSVNPVDVKLRAQRPPTGEGPAILGYDAAGVVKTVGSDVTLFRSGDPVFYAGAIDRPGTNSEFHVVDERLVGRRPKNLSPVEAAALPLTSITAWELLFERLEVPIDGGKGETLVVIGGAGGVGSILVQMARQLTELTVVASASRPQTRAWVEKMGAHHVINHREPLPAQIQELDLEPRYVASLTATDQHFPALVELLAPQGRLALIDDPAPGAIDVGLLKLKSLSLHWELMFTRSLFQTPDMIEQHRLLNRVADLVDDGRLRTTAEKHLGAMTTDNLRQAHALQESGRAMGKTTLAGFGSYPN